MPSYILTGAPGAGKTAVLRMLEAGGYAVVEEAATDVIALGNALGRDEPWQDSDFIGKILALQRQRQDAARSGPGATVFFDRSPACTLALSRYLAGWLGAAPPAAVAGEVGALLARGGYETTVFFVRNLGFVRPTAARRISLEDSLVFERIHEETYRELGFRLVDVPAGPLAERAELIARTVRAAALSRDGAPRPAAGQC